MPEVVQPAIGVAVKPACTSSGVRATLLGGLKIALGAAAPLGGTCNLLGSPLFSALVLALFLASPANVWSAELKGEVVSIADGDTLTVLDTNKRQYKVRLAGIDAPEKKQPFGDRSRRNLASLLFRSQIAVEWTKRDRYGRLVGVVRVGGTDAGLQQIRAGMAWHYKTYQREQSRLERAAYADAEVQARQTRAGLWGDSNPQPPWDFRRARR
jgi:endonuclease YncB( thermonuclease family)